MVWPDETKRRDGTRGREKRDIGREVMGEGGAEREARPFFDPYARWSDQHQFFEEPVLALWNL